MSQSNLWQTQSVSNEFAELCNGLYQREISRLAKGNFGSAQAIQVRLKSLPYYITRTAHSMMEVVIQDNFPLQLDCQNASWSVKQTQNIPLVGKDIEQNAEQSNAEALAWYFTKKVSVGLVVPVLINQHLILDCIDRIDIEKQRLRTNVAGWFSSTMANPEVQCQNNFLHKPTKKIMLAACAGHRWQGSNKLIPVVPSLRELLLSCRINWKHFNKSSEL